MASAKSACLERRSARQLAALSYPSRADAARALMVLMGISLLLDGILNICVAWFCVKIVRNQRPDGIDEEYEELKDE